MTEENITSASHRIERALVKKDSSRDELIQLYFNIISTSGLLNSPHFERDETGAFVKVEIPRELLFQLRQLVGRIAELRFTESLTVLSESERVERINHMLPSCRRGMETGRAVERSQLQAEAWSAMLKNNILFCDASVSDWISLSQLKQLSTRSYQSWGMTFSRPTDSVYSQEALDHAELYAYLTHVHRLNTVDGETDIPLEGRVCQLNTNSSQGSVSTAGRLTFTPEGKVCNAFLSGGQADFQLPADQYDRVVIIAFPDNQKTLVVPHRSGEEYSLNDKIIRLISTHNRETGENLSLNKPVNIVYLSFNDSSEHNLKQVLDVCPAHTQLNIFKASRERGVRVSKELVNYQLNEFKPKASPSYDYEATSLRLTGDGRNLKVAFYGNTGHIGDRTLLNPISWNKETARVPGESLLGMDCLLLRQVYEGLSCPLTGKSPLDIKSPIFDQYGTVYEKEAILREMASNLYHAKTWELICLRNIPKFRSLMDELKEYRAVLEDGSAESSRTLAFTQFLLQELEGVIDQGQIHDLKDPVLDRDGFVYERENLRNYVDEKGKNPRTSSPMTMGDLLPMPDWLENIISTLRSMNAVGSLEALDYINSDEMERQARLREPEPMDTTDSSHSSRETSTSLPMRRKRSHEEDSSSSESVKRPHIRPVKKATQRRKK